MKRGKEDVDESIVDDSDNRLQGALVSGKRTKKDCKLISSERGWREVRKLLGIVQEVKDDDDY